MGVGTLETAAIVNMVIVKRTSIICCVCFLLGVLSCEKGKSLLVSKPRVAPAILKESWEAYSQRFIQKDGRVIDYSAGTISTSEGQAYAMLRAVWIGDRDTFDRAFKWGMDNLNSGIRSDSLWAWKWGNDSKGNWGVLDKAFASDADQDAALALILAARVWREERYAEHARTTIKDLWRSGTIEAAGRRYLLSGDTLCKGTTCRINPSYYAPYAYRIFAGVDRRNDWAGLVDTSYRVLSIVSGFATTGLPADWVQLNTSSGEVSRASDKDSAFSYDAFRVYWRIGLDWELFHDERANRYLRDNLKWISGEWEKYQKLPAVISPAGNALAEYESMEMLSALMAVLRNDTMRARLDAAYSKGIWGDRNSYYLQNWAWFGTALYSGYLGPFELVK